MWYIYFDGDGVLQATQTFSEDIITKYAIVSMLYWDADNNQVLAFAEERHGRVMDGMTHLYLHNTVGARYASGLALGNIVADGNGDLETTAQFSIADGVIWDEDIKTTITNGQYLTLSPVAGLPKIYRSGAAGNWRKTAITNYVVTTTGSGRAAYNQWTGSTWQLTEVSSGGFLLSHVFATNCFTCPAIVVVGQATYSTIASARAGAETELKSLSVGQLGGLFREFVPIATLICETSNSYDNAVKTRIRTTDTGAQYIDWRGAQISASTGGTAVSDHGVLSGLSDDDHTQYLLADGVRQVNTDVGFGVITTNGSAEAVVQGTNTGVVTVSGTNKASLILDSSTICEIDMSGTPGDARVRLQTSDMGLLLIVNTTAVLGISDDSPMYTYIPDYETLVSSDDHIPNRKYITDNFQPLDAQLTDIAGLTPTKGNIIVGNGTNYVSVGVGTNNQVLTADSAQTAGVKWAAIAADTPSVYSQTYSSDMSIDVGGYDVVRCTLTGNPEIGFTGGTDGQKFILELKQDATGSRTVTWDSTVRFGTDITSVTLSTAANKTDRIGFVYNSSAGKYDVVAAVRGF